MRPLCSVLVAVVVVSGGCSMERRSSTTPPADTPQMPATQPVVSHQSGLMLEATQRAWAGMNEIDAQANSQDFGGYPSQYFRQTAFAYSQLPLANVDQALVKHLIHSVTFCKRAATAFEQLETKRDELDQRTNNAAELGAALGAAAAADGATHQSATGFAALFGGLAAAGASAESESLQAECAAVLRQLEPEIKAIEQAEAELSHYLTQKYSVPFIDPF